MPELKLRTLVAELHGMLPRDANNDIAGRITSSLGYRIEEKLGEIYEALPAPEDFAATTGHHATCDCSACHAERYGGSDVTGDRITDALDAVEAIAEGVAARYPSFPPEAIDRAVAYTVTIYAALAARDDP